MASEVVSCEPVFVDVELQDIHNRPRSLSSPSYHGLTQRKLEESEVSLSKEQNEPRDDHTEPESLRSAVILFGVDISSFSPTTQFLLCAGGAFAFTIVYGYLQELLSVHVADRKFALFLAACQFAGYALWSLFLTKLRKPSSSSRSSQKPAPMRKFIVLSVVRAFDLAMTNMAMQFLNYPAKTLIKSSRVIFTMLLGVLLHKRRYTLREYGIVMTMVFGLAIFLHADFTSSALFHPLGVLLLVTSLVCDGAINNLSEKLMDTYAMTQDEYHVRLYSIALIATVAAAHLNHELFEGIDYFLLRPGTVAEIASDTVEGTAWPIPRKAMVLILFSATGIFGASCLGAIIKRFGALTMAMTSTARKASTLFLSFFLFNNACTFEHAAGVFLFVSALVVKSFGVKNKMKQGGVPATQDRETHRWLYKALSLEDKVVSDLSLDTVVGDSSDESDFESVVTVTKL